MIYRREFAQRGENAYALGLLHDLGIIIEDQFLNEKLVQALGTAHAKGIALPDAEQETLGYDHARIGMSLSENWKLPEEISLGIGYHHNPVQTPQPCASITRVLHIANYCCQKGDIGFCDAPQQEDDLFHQCVQDLNLELHALELIKIGRASCRERV